METTHNGDDDMQSNAVWDRGKTNLQDMEYVKRLESSLETYLEALPPDDENQMISYRSHNSNNILDAYLLNFDNVSNDDDVDLESFNDDRANQFNNNYSSESSNGITLSNKSNEPNAQINRNTNRDDVETASLSNFHNIQYIEYIHEKLEQYLKTCKDGPSSTQLETKIAELKRELEKYVEMINQKKENELRRFSENMSNHSNIVHIKNAFMKREMQTTTGSNAANYDNVSFEQTDAVSYYSNDSIIDYERCRSGNFDGFFMKHSYDRCSFNTNFDTNSVEYYSMLIAEERGDNLVNDAPIPPPRTFNELDRISLIYRNPDDQIIKQWQKYQLNTITIKPKKKNDNNKMVKIKMTKNKKRTYDIWSFTLDYHKTKMLQIKLEKERKIRFICRMFFYFFGLACFILVVIIVQSIFNVRKK